MTEYTNEELVDLIQKTPDHSEQMKYLAALYEQNRLYFFKICKRFSVYEETDDLMQEVFFGLMRAAEKYTPMQDVPFINYAAFWIEQAIRRYIDNSGSVMRLPVYLRNSIIKYEKKRQSFRKENGRDPSDDELRKELNLTDEQFKKLKERAIFLTTTSLDKNVGEADSLFTLKDVIPDPEDHYEELTDRIDEDQRRQDIWSEVKTLDDKRSQIIEQRFKTELSLQAIGNNLGLSKERVRQLQNSALKILSKSKKLEKYADEYRDTLSAKAYSRTGLTSFRNTRTSSTERTAIEMYDYKLNAYTRKIKKDIRLIEEKYNITLGDEYLQQKIEEYKTMLQASI